MITVTVGVLAGRPGAADIVYFEIHCHGHDRIVQGHPGEIPGVCDDLHFG